MIRTGYFGIIIITIVTLVGLVLRLSTVASSTQSTFRFDVQAAYMPMMNETDDAIEASVTAVMATLQAEAVQTSAPMTMTATLETPIPTLDVSATAVRLTLAPAFTPVASNAYWIPVKQDFDGVPMVLVPAGCFTMGSTEEQIDYAMTLSSGNGRELYANETPTTRVCFAEPFWIDLYEVTQGDFARLGGQAANENYFDGENRPRATITWYEARGFCTLRGARLPTEAEWEYAARGPDSLIYPWGNTFVAENVVYSRDASQATADVSSIDAGRSWVGAYDLSGNVWEWTSTLYAEYPYPTDSSGFISDDGREDENSTDVRVLRGGSWLNNDNLLRASNRDWDDPSGRDGSVGVRCARNAG